jgi:hypothetical protein
VLESKVELALACLAAGSAACPATLFVPWATERLPPELHTAAFASSPPPLWVLKRDALSNGEGIFFVADGAQAEAVIAEQRPAGYMTLLSGREASDYVLQRHVDAPLLLAGRRKFHLRAYVAVWPAAGNDAAASSSSSPTVALWEGVEVRLAAKAYDGDVADRLQMLTNFAPNAGAAGDAIKRMAPEFEGELAAACPAWQLALTVLAADTATLAEGELEGAGSITADDGAQWVGFALLAMDVMMDESGRMWLLEVNRGPAAGDESVDDTLQSGPYRQHMAALAAALLARGAPPCAGGSGAAWPRGFTPLPPPRKAPAWGAHARRQLRPLLRMLPPSLQAGLALAARAGAGRDAPVGGDAVASELARIAGARPFPEALAAYRDSNGCAAAARGHEVHFEVVALTAHGCALFGCCVHAGAAQCTPPRSLGWRTRSRCLARCARRW